MSFETESQAVIDKNSDVALLVINLDTGAIAATPKWRTLNQVPEGEPVTRALLMNTIATDSVAPYVEFSKAFFASDTLNETASIDLNLRTCKGDPFRGHVTAYKANLGGTLCAITAMQPID